MADLPLLASEALSRLEEWGGPDMPRKMIDIFLTHTPDRLEEIREGVAESDPGLVETGAHTLKSSAGNLGAFRLQELCQQAELMAEEKRMGELERILPELESAYAATCQEFRKLLEGMEE